MNRHFDFSNLTPTERVELAQALWDSLDPASGTDVLPLTEAQRAELDARLADLERNQTAGSSWDEVQSRLRERLEQERRQKRGA
jgi:putative addiction module component (TIGR02574 family)